jgi:hypothetical protein
MAQAIIETLIRQTVEIPEGTDKQDVYNFLAENQSFRDAFVGMSDAEQTFRIVDVEVVDEDVVELDGEAE